MKIYEVIIVINDPDGARHVVLNDRAYTRIEDAQDAFENAVDNAEREHQEDLVYWKERLVTERLWESTSEDGDTVDIIIEELELE